jgi:hypothetical protein
MAERLKMKYRYPVVEICFMSRLGPHFPEIMKSVSVRGLKKCWSFPIFCIWACTFYSTFPNDAARSKEISGDRDGSGKGLGYDELLVDMVHKCIQKSKREKDVRELSLPSDEAFPIPQGQCEFVPMLPEEAARYRLKGSE